MQQDTTFSVDKIKLLSDIFPKMAVHELHELSRLTTAHQYKPGTYLCREGAYEDVFYILATGEVAITKKLGGDDREHLLRIARTGAYFGEMALIQNTTRAASICTRTDTITLEMRKDDFETAMRTSPHLAFNIMNAIINRLRANDQAVIAELRSVNETLQMLDRNKMEFIEVTAHELRTPITIMKGYVRMLEMNPLIKSNPLLRQIVSGTLSGTNRLLEVVNAMLDVTRLANNDIKLIPTQVIPRIIINDLVNAMRKDIKARRIKVTQKHNKKLPPIIADSRLIEKAIDHLLHNAIKYTPDGGHIHIETQMATLSSNQSGVEIRFTDTGIGIDPSQQTLIFEKFYQVGEAALHSSGQTSFKGGGPGVGLAIVKGVAESHGGCVWVESQGHDEENMPGSTFFLQLPMSPIQ